MICSLRCLTLLLLLSSAPPRKTWREMFLPWQQEVASPARSPLNPSHFVTYRAPFNFTPQPMPLSPGAPPSNFSVAQKAPSLACSGGALGSSPAGGTGVSPTYQESSSPAFKPRSDVTPRDVSDWARALPALSGACIPLGGAQMLRTTWVKGWGHQARFWKPCFPARCSPCSACTSPRDTRHPPFQGTGHHWGGFSDLLDEPQSGESFTEPRRGSFPSTLQSQFATRTMSTPILTPSASKRGFGTARGGSSRLPLPSTQPLSSSIAASYSLP